MGLIWLTGLNAPDHDSILLDQVKETLGAVAEKNVADSGYYSTLISIMRPCSPELHSHQ